jgi:hypothetical protein
MHQAIVNAQTYVNRNRMYHVIKEIVR